VTESEHEGKARDFVDSILAINRQHGVDTASAEIEYEAAVESAAKTFRGLRRQADESLEDGNNKPPVYGE
jgi:hypothetical protein